MRFRLRTLLIVLALGPPVLAWLWLTPEWDRYRSARTDVQALKGKFDRVKADASAQKASLAPIWSAAARHHELRYVRADANARRKSILYRLLTPKPASPIGP